MRKKADAYGLIFCTALMVFIAYILYLATKMPFGTMRNPGPNFIPYLSGGIAFVLLLITVLKEYDLNLKNYMGKKINLNLKENKLILFTLGSIAYLVLFAYVNVSVANFVVTIALMKVTDVKGWKGPILYSAILTLVLWLCFVKWLAVPFPSGILG